MKEKLSPQQRANLRVCMLCKWIFKRSENDDSTDCPKCKWPSYGAKFVYGNKAYNYEWSQKPWKDKKISKYSLELEEEISLNQKVKMRNIKFVKLSPIIFIDDQLLNNIK